MNQDSYTRLGNIRLSFFVDLCFETSSVNRVKIYCWLFCMLGSRVWSESFCTTLMSKSGDWLKWFRYTWRDDTLLNDDVLYKIVKFLSFLLPMGF